METQAEEDRGTLGAPSSQGGTISEDAAAGEGLAGAGCTASEEQHTAWSPEQGASGLATAGG